MNEKDPAKNVPTNPSEDIQTITIGLSPGGMPSTAEALPAESRSFSTGKHFAELSPESKISTIFDIQEHFKELKTRIARYGEGTRSGKLVDIQEAISKGFVKNLMDKTVQSEADKVVLTKDGLELIDYYFNRQSLPTPDEILCIGTIIKNAQYKSDNLDNNLVRKLRNMTKPEAWILNDQQRSWFRRIAEAPGLQIIEIDSEADVEQIKHESVYKLPPPSRKVVSFKQGGLNIVDASNHNRGVKPPKRKEPNPPGRLIQLVSPTARRQVRNNMYKPPGKKWKPNNRELPLDPAMREANDKRLTREEMIKLKTEMFDKNPRLRHHPDKIHNNPSSQAVLGLAKKEALERLQIDRFFREQKAARYTKFTSIG